GRRVPSVRALRPRGPGGRREAHVRPARRGLRPARHAGHEPPVLGPARAPRGRARGAPRPRGQRRGVPGRGPRRLRRRPVVRFLAADALDRLRSAAQWPDLSQTRYEVLEPIARGGMGTVYLARDRDLEREVAIKVLSVPEPGPGAAERMLREARIIARLEHPGIVPVHDVGTLPDGRVYYAMKRVSRRRLHALAGEPLADRLRVFERICEPVAFAHAHGVVHRDLKPENVMVGPFGEVLVMDWGVAKIVVGSANDLAPPS